MLTDRVELKDLDIPQSMQRCMLQTLAEHKGGHYSKAAAQSTIWMPAVRSKNLGQRMTDDQRCRTIIVVAVLVGFAGCAGPSGPILGEWQGNQPGGNPDTPDQVDLVLEGGPGAVSGQYHITTTVQNPNQFSHNGTQEWGGQWTSERRDEQGKAMQFITLHDHLANQVGGYALRADGKLHALDPRGSVDSSRDGALYTLSPVRPRGTY